MVQRVLVISGRAGEAGEGGPLLRSPLSSLLALLLTPRAGSHLVSLYAAPSQWRACCMAVAVHLHHVFLDHCSKVRTVTSWSATGPAQRCCLIPEAWLTFLCPHAARLKSVCLKRGSVSHALRHSRVLTLDRTGCSVQPAR